ncbi:MAG TPA: hypothetical protein VEC12_10350 [Bacteroidia bacterium]|nr:hypothetical protein [Bacteroidia bacterium]
MGTGIVNTRTPIITLRVSSCQQEPQDDNRSANRCQVCKPDARREATPQAIERWEMVEM